MPSPRPSTLPMTSTNLSGVPTQGRHHTGGNPMNRFFCFVTLFAATLTLTISTVARTQTDPAALAQHYLETLDRDDAARLLALCAEDVVIDGGGGCTAAPCVGKAALQKELERRAADNPPVH